ncbi:MAG TPA: hypothetical protein VGV60_05425 [Candidatus Polarisedimenticolia bacterium]|jgi:hypothetical protein|nr:hypothetical protein [Candidatus Polarisedimenticolia bacterium]
MTSRTRLRLAFAFCPSAIGSFAFFGPRVLAAAWHPFGLQGIELRPLAVAPGRLCAGTAGRGVFCLDL